MEQEDRRRRSEEKREGQVLTAFDVVKKVVDNELVGAHKLVGGSVDLVKAEARDGKLGLGGLGELSC
jgi:hypothetical protein